MTLSPDDNPAFLDPERATSIGYVGADVVPKFDYELQQQAKNEEPVEGVKARYSEIARLHAMGRTNNDIARILGYTASRVSILLREPFVQSEIQRYRSEVIDADAIQRMKHASKDGGRVIHDIILDETIKPEIRLKAAAIAVEMTHGKATQKVEVENNSLQSFAQALREMQARNEPIDVSPGAQPIPLLESKAEDQPEPVQQWDHWLDTNPF